MSALAASTVCTRTWCAKTHRECVVSHSLAEDHSTIGASAAGLNFERTCGYSPADVALAGKLPEGRECDSALPAARIATAVFCRT